MIDDLDVAFLDVVHRCGVGQHVIAQLVAHIGHHLAQLTQVVHQDAHVRRRRDHCFAKVLLKL
jgi:hypothetical protein